MNKVAFGCSHTYGIGVSTDQTWPSLLNAKNFGKPGCSSDYVVRQLAEVLLNQTVDIVYILWPDWTRFEYVKFGSYRQSLPTDSDRIYHMEYATDEWLLNNFNIQRNRAIELCSDIRLIDMTLYDLIPYIDHSDLWPKANDGSHFNHEWHRWVADIFNEKT